MNTRILLVEDHPNTGRDLRSILLRAFGGTVDVAVDGAEGVTMAQQTHPDVTVLDIDLPVLNGFEVLNQLKERHIPTRVIMLSGMYIEIDSAVRAIKAGACDYLIKPVEPQKLIEHIKKAMITDATINLRMASEIPPLTLELIERLEAHTAKDSPSASSLRAAPMPAPPAPVIATPTSDLRDTIIRHWLVVLISIVAAVGAVMWAIMTTLYVAPRDFEITRLRSVIDNTRNAQERQISPKPESPPNVESDRDPSPSKP